MSKLKPLPQVISLDSDKTMVISHRGDWSRAPENSIEAMLVAAQIGADMVELDVQRTRSGHLLLMHDDTTERMTNQSGLTASVTDHALKSLTLREGRGGPEAPITSITVPSLRQTLEAARGKVHLNIDTKHRRDLEVVGDLVRDMEMADQVLIKMIVDPENPDAAIKDARWFDDLTFMPVMLAPRPGRLVKDAVSLTRYFQSRMIEISFPSLEELDELARVMRTEGVRLWCNTLDPVHPLDFSDSRAVSDPAGVWGTLIDNGIGAIQTDHTDALLNYLKDREQRPGSR